MHLLAFFRSGEGPGDASGSSGSWLYKYKEMHLLFLQSASYISLLYTSAKQNPTWLTFTLDCVAPPDSPSYKKSLLSPVV